MAEDKDTNLFPYKKQGKAWQLYKQINWVDWWDEFNSALIPKGPGAGHRKYRNVWQFIRLKTRIQWQRDAIWKMIGPKPDVKPGEMLAAPWLGNWDTRRKLSFYSAEQLSGVARKLREKVSGQEAIRSLAKPILNRIAYWQNVSNTIQQEFGVPLDRNEKLTSEAQEKRMNLFFQWQKQCEDVIASLEGQFMRVNGMDPSDPMSQYLLMAMGGQIGAASALTGVAATQPNQINGQIPGRPKLLDESGKELPLPDNVSYDSILFADMLKNHAKTYSLPLPEKTDKSNGKHKTQ